jgi:outer membrane lipoprotein-sorting protein
MILTVALLAAAAAPADDPAETLFRKMEKKVIDAQTLSAKFTTEVDAKEAGPFKGRFAAAAGNKFRIEMEGKVRGTEERITMVCDGAKVRMVGPGGMPNDQDARKEMGGMIRVAAARVGLLAPLFLTRARATDDPKKDDGDGEKAFAASGFKLGKKEAVGGVEAQAVEYTVTFAGMKETFAVTTWIDPKTSLPVKRVLVVPDGSKKVTITEMYTDFAVGGKVDDKDFVLPN